MLIKLYLGGNGLLSKRPRDFRLKNGQFITKAKGIFLWDLNGKKLIDMSIMGIGTSILGYANNQVDNFVKKNY